MEDTKIVDLVIARLKQDDLWFTTKADPTWEEPADYYKLDEYGDLEQTSIKKIAKEVTDLIGEGAVDIDDAVEIWLQDAMVEYKVAYKDSLVTKFKDKPVVDGIEAFENPVQLAEGKKLKTESKEEVIKALKELNVSTFQELRDEIDRMLEEGIINEEYEDFLDIISDKEEACEDYINRRSDVTNTDWKDELYIESDYLVDAISELIQEVSLTEGKVTTPKGEFEYEEIQANEKKVKDAFKSFWNGEITGEELEKIKNEMNKVLTWAEIENCQYDASREVDNEKEVKTEDYFDKMDKLRQQAEADMIEALKQAFPEGKVSDVIESKYSGDRIQLTLNGKRITVYFMDEEGEDGKPWFMVITDKKAGKSYSGNIEEVIDFIKTNIIEVKTEDVDTSKYPDVTGNIDEYHLQNETDNPVWITGYVGCGDKIYDVSAKVFIVGSKFGIDNGQVSKLWIKERNADKPMCSYDRGWDIKPKREDKANYDAILKLVVDYRNANPYEVEEENVNFNNCTKDKKIENYKRRLKEENNKSANLISDMFQSSDFDADSKQGQIVMRTSELFNALSDKGYDVQVSFDNGESTNAVLLGQQGGQVIITINNTDQPLRAFASGNFEITNDNMNVLKDIQEQITTL